MNNYVSVIFCRRCGSRYVEIDEWSDDNNPILHCRSCNNEEKMTGFTLGRAGINNVQLQHARDTVAKGGKYEK